MDVDAVIDSDGGGVALKRSPWAPARSAKFRQAAFGYLHVAVLYEAAAFAMLGEGLLPTRFGPPWLWLVFGGVVAGIVFFGLYRWQNVWFVRVIWLVVALRLPTMIRGAFFPAEDARLVPGFYLTALIVIVVQLWLLARAGWDL